MGEEIKIGGEQRWARGHRCRGDTIVMGEGDRGRGGAERCWPEARETACQWEEEKVPPKHSASPGPRAPCPLTGKADLQIQTLGREDAEQ